MSGWDYMAWQLEMERLVAEANEHADAVCRILGSGETMALSRALDRHERWEATQRQLAAHMADAEKLRAGNG